MQKVLTAEHISVTLGGREIIHDISFHLQRGEFVGIIGPNGAGKSTLLKAIRGIYHAGAGEVTLLGKDLQQMKEKEIARELAYMQQDVQIGFGFTAEEIVLSARYPYLSWWENEGEEDRKIVEECMRFTGVYTLKDKAVQQLSGGERQRVLLAKVLAQQTPIIFLDEPTASLDLVYQEEIFRYCCRLTEAGKTVVMICHDLEMSARFCSRLVLIADGRIHADGKPTEVLTQENLQAAFGLQSVVYRNPLTDNLNIYSYEGNTTGAPFAAAAVCGDGAAAMRILRALHNSGIPVLLGGAAPDSLVAYGAEAFGVTRQQSGTDLAAAFCYGIHSRSAWAAAYPVLARAQRVYFSRAETEDYWSATEAALIQEKLAAGSWQDCSAEQAYAAAVGGGSA